MCRLDERVIVARLQALEAECFIRLLLVILLLLLLFSYAEVAGIAQEK